MEKFSYVDSTKYIKLYTQHETPLEWKKNITVTSGENRLMFRKIIENQVNQLYSKIRHDTKMTKFVTNSLTF